MAIKTGNLKGQPKNKQKRQELFREVHDHVQSFVLLSHTTHGFNKEKRLVSCSDRIINLHVLWFVYVYRIFILFFGHFNDYFLQISLVKPLVVSYVSYLYENNHVNVDAAVDILS